MKDILEKIAQQSVPESTNLWPRIAAQLDERKSLMNIVRTRPLVVILVTLLILLTLSGVAYALGTTLGYFPGVGLVENTGNLRMLAEPVKETRDGVTLTITSVFVYADRVELIYDVKGIDPSNDGSQPQNASEDLKAFCGPQSSSDGDYLSDGDAALRLPNGTLVKRMFGTEYPQNVFAMKPVYKVSIPSDVNDLTMVLKCIPLARLGAVPENWEVPFKLVAVPEGTRVGEPVVDVNATSEPVTAEAVPPPEATAPAKVAAPTQALPSPQVTLTLESAVQLDTGTIFYFHLDVEDRDPSLVSLRPRNVYVIDSLGHKIQAFNNGPVSEYPVGATFEYITSAKPADGALTLVVEDAVAKYAPLDETTFTFDVGENPQPGQTWELNKEFDIAGYKVEVVSARAVTYSDIEVNPEMWDPQTNQPYRSPEGSQGFDYGYQFTFKIDPSLGMSNVAMDIQSDSCGMGEVRPMGASPLKFYTELCRDGYPKGNVKVILRSISVIVKNVGQVVWSPQ
jgi:hypothetical protein